MLNEYIAVGRITHILKNEQDDNKVKVTLAITRPEKNVDGEYEKDYIPFYLKGELAETVSEYCSKGDVIGIKGSLEKRGRDITIIGKRLSLLSSKTQTTSERREE